jgi:hypothetical protein
VSSYVGIDWKVEEGGRWNVANGWVDPERMRINRVYYAVD